MDVTAESCLLTFSRATLLYDLTCPAPPAHVQSVDQATDPAELRELKVVVWDPEVACAAPQLLW